MRRVLVLGAPGDAEAGAALAWARTQGWDVGAITLEGVTSAGLAGADVIWCHAGVPLPPLPDAPGVALAGAVRAGTHVVLSLLAVTLASRLGAADLPPEVQGPQPWRHDADPRWPAAFRDWPGYPHVRGFQGWGEHPLFAGLQGGAFTWMACEGDRVARAVHARPSWPRTRVVAVDRSYVHLDPDVAVAWEYELGGRLTCLGANLHFTAGDPSLHPQRDALLRNAIRDTAVPGLQPRVGWPGAQRQHAAVSPSPRPRSLVPPPARFEAFPSIDRSLPDEAPVTLGAQRALLVGTLDRGVREVWLESLCVLDGGIELATDAGSPAAARAVATPVHLERTLQGAPGGSWRELAAVHREEPEFLYALTPAPAGDAVALEFRVPLRRQWPYRADALVPVRVEVRRDGASAAVIVTGCDGRHAAAVYLDGVDAIDVVPDDAAPMVRAVGLPANALCVVIRASVDGVRGLTLAGRDLGAALRQAGDAVDGLLHGACQFASSDEGLTHAWTWACARLGNFMAAAPRGGRGLRAGFAASRPGWNVSRPGYAWFFGRDACWCVDALLAAGLFEEARDAIDLLARTADVTGKAIHELTTSGVAHYDAADSTPLFLRAVAVYAQWTGDLPTLRAWWPAVRLAFAFVASCDRDGDGLPENTGVGHGWIEMGPLGGGAVTSYVAAIWIDGLRRLEPVARALGDGAFVQAIVGARRSAERGLEALRLSDGRLSMHRDVAGRLYPDVTAMSAVPIALEVDASSSVGPVLEALNAPRFTTPWGLRMLPNDHPTYDPAAYHAGTVWPLFSGWAALADCVAGRLDAGLARVRSVVHGGMAAGTGGFAEVLHGDTGARAGVCPDQAWSAAMAITPLVRGLAGVQPDALGARCGLRAALPRDLSLMTLSGLRVGASRLDVRWERQGTEVAVDATLVAGPDVDMGIDGVPRQACTAARPARWRVPDEGGR